MKTSLFAAAAASAALTLIGTASAATISVTAASAPNGFGSPSYGAWVNNAITALAQGDLAFGTPGTPTYYQAAGATMDLSENIVTGFPSWQGVANPAAPFAAELGNRLLFGVVVKAAAGEKVSISQLGFNMVSTDPTGSLNYSYAMGAYNYNNDYRGVLFGADGAFGGGDDTWITGGANTQAVDMIVGRGSGNAWAVYDSSPGATRQEKIDLAIGELYDQGFDFTGTYTYGTSATGSDTVHFNATASVPDAGATAGMLLLAMGALVAGRRSLKG